jgi:hypothetical protein
MNTARLTSTMFIQTVLAVAFGTLCCPFAAASIQSCQSLAGTQLPPSNSKTVQLPAGQYLIDIRGTRDDCSFIITDTVVAHASTAKVIVQTGAKNCRITVLSGTVIAKNTVEHHIVELPAGTVYDTELLAANGRNDSGAFNDYLALADPNSWLPLFQSKLCKTTLGTLSDRQLLACPFAGVLDNRLRLNRKVEACHARIVSPPTVLNYQIGADASKHMSVPSELMQHYPPIGTITTQTERLVADNP